MPLWAWHRPPSFLILWVLVAATNSVQNDTTQALTTSKSSTQEHFHASALHSSSLKEKFSQGAPAWTTDYSFYVTGRKAAVTNTGITGDVTVSSKGTVTEGTKIGTGSTEKDTLEHYGDPTPFGTKIRIVNPHDDVGPAKKETMPNSVPTFPSVFRNNSNDGFGTKIQRDEPEHTENDAELEFKHDAMGQHEATQEASSNSTFSPNTTLHDFLEETNSSANQFSSPAGTFTRAHLLPSVSNYDEGIAVDSRFFTRTTFPYGSRFYPKTSAFYSNLNTLDVEHSKWSSDIWSPEYTTKWTEEPLASCSSLECGDGHTLQRATTPLFRGDPVSPVFFRTDRELWVNNYKGNTYIDPSHTATDITKAKSRRQSSISPKGESEPADITVLGYDPLDEEFGMRITRTKELSSDPTHTKSTTNSPSTALNRLSNANAESTADNTIPVEFQKKTKEFENRHELGSSYSNGNNANFRTNNGQSEGTVLKTNKWTAVKAAEGNTLGEMSIQWGNSSQAVATSDIFSFAINQTAENLPNSLFSPSFGIMNHPNMPSGETESTAIFSTRTVNPDYFYNSFGVLQALNVTSSITPTSVKSTIGEIKNEMKYSYGNMSFADTHYQKNAIDYNKQDKVLKSDEQSTTEQRDYGTFSSKIHSPFQFSGSAVHDDAYTSDTVHEDEIPMYSGAFYASRPLLVTSSEHDALFGDRIFSQQPPVTTFGGISSPATKISTIDANEAAFSPYIFSSFYDTSSSYDEFIPHSAFAQTPFVFSSVLNSRYLLSSYWEKQIPEDSIFGESAGPMSIHFMSNFIHTEDREAISSTTIEPTSISFRSSTVDPFSMHESSILYFVSSSHPHLVSLLAGKNRTDVTVVQSESEESSFPTASTFQPPRVSKQPTPSNVDHEVPPPRITNPSCNALPTCITMTIGMTWTEFCPVSDHLRKQLVESLSETIKPIHPHQLVLSSDHHQCKTPGQESEVFSSRRRRRRRRRRSETFVEIRIFVVDHDGEYDENLTEICFVLLKKWMPKAGAPFQNKILEVRISRVGEDIEETSVPETIPAESPTSSGIIAAITISTIAGACLFLLCILLVVMKQRLLQNRNCNPALDAYSLDSFSINASFRRRRVRQSMRSFLNHAFEDPELPSHPLNESGLVNCLKNTKLLEEEFKKLPMNMPKLEQIPSGAEVKNRYANVLPNPDTRVLLSASTDDPLKEYINANYVKGYDGKHRAYIATQAPLPETVNDFWQMVWEQQSKVIIMLTLLEENGVPRSAAYFPESTLDCHKLYGDFQVSLQKKDIREFYTMSTFRLYHLEKNLFREVAHFWYTAWPAVGVPSDPGYLVTFLLQARPFINTNSGPTVVHCSPGTGRTGVILALDMSMKEFEQSRSVDLLRCMARIRKDRGGAVQNKEQYILLHEAMVEYASYIANQSQRPSIRSND